jgi:transcriptional regulator with XRE-family HTH domain
MPVFAEEFKILFDKSRGIYYAHKRIGGLHSMKQKRLTFGQVIVRERKNRNLNQKELAMRVLKEDGIAISPTYLNDIEHDRRNPPSPFLIEQFAKALKLRPEVLYYYAGELPKELSNFELDSEQIIAAYAAFKERINSAAA